ncbi:MAG: hypothetical protein AABY07_01345 [Nanoarchaeota archaeon]
MEFIVIHFGPHNQPLCGWFNHKEEFCLNFDDVNCFFCRQEIEKIQRNRKDTKR